MKSNPKRLQLVLPVLAAVAFGAGLTGMATPVAAAPLQVAVPMVSDRFDVEVLGQGPDVILLHGYASSREVWRPVADRLAATHRVHLVQMAGFAGQPWTHGDGAYFQPLLDDLALYAAGLDKPAFIGHSMGGLSGLLIAQQHPDLLSKVMSVDSLPFFGAMMDPNATADSMRPMALQLAGAIRTAPAFMLRAQQQQTAVTMTLTQERRAEIVAASDASDRQALASGIVDLMAADARAGLSEMTTPLWAVYAVDHSGPQGEMAQSLWAREYAAVPNVKLEPVENSRHFIMYDQPERLNALIDQFLSDQP